MRAVGFDLDMTLVDTRPGITIALRALAEQTSRALDVGAIVDNLGPPIAEALSPWFSPAEIPDAVHAFRRLMADVGVRDVVPLPGAAAAIAAARAAGCRVIVATSKIEPLALATLDNAGLAVDRAFGDVWAEQKAVPLRACHAVCFVGDQPADMKAAAQAEIAGFGVTSGSATRDDLVAAGAGYVADSLEAFEPWLSKHLTRV